MKNTIRKEILRKRDGIPDDIRANKNLRIKEILFTLPEFLKAITVLYYASFRSEVETLGMINESIAMGKRVVLPKVDRKRHRLNLYEIKDIQELSLGYMEIPEPSIYDKRNVIIEDIDLAIIPGSAFDYYGNRLGYGAGYYDILLSGSKSKAIFIGLAYEEQLVDVIPQEEHDVKVDIIVTDERVIRIAKNI